MLSWVIPGVASVRIEKSKSSVANMNAIEWLLGKSPYRVKGVSQTRREEILRQASTTGRKLTAKSAASAVHPRYKLDI